MLAEKTTAPAHLYPPVWAVTREATEADVIDGYPIPARSMVLVSPYVTHRLPSVWERPDQFEPERFSPERAATLPRFAYFPFLGGPRQCIGNTFAMMEAQIILGTLARRFRLVVAPGHVVKPEAHLTLRPRHGMPMRLHVRA